MIGAPTELLKRIHIHVCDEIGINPNMALGCVDLEKSEEFFRDARKKGWELNNLNVAVLKDDPFPGHQFITDCIIVGVEAYQESCSIAQDTGHSGISASTEQMKSQCVSDLFDQNHPRCVLPSCTGSSEKFREMGYDAQVIKNLENNYPDLDEAVQESQTTRVMLILCELGGFQTSVWKKTKDERLTLRASAVGIVDLTFEFLVSGRRRWE